jgi:hypothetical protein
MYVLHKNVECVQHVQIIHACTDTVTLLITHFGQKKPERHLPRPVEFVSDPWHQYPSLQKPAWQMEVLSTIAMYLYSSQYVMKKMKYMAFFKLCVQAHRSEL